MKTSLCISSPTFSQNHQQAHQPSNLTFIFRDQPQGCQKHCYHIKNFMTRKLCQDKKSFIAVRRRLFEFQKQISFFTETVDGKDIEKPEFRFRYWWTYNDSLLFTRYRPFKIKDVGKTGYRAFR